MTTVDPTRCCPKQCLRRSADGVTYRCRSCGHRRDAVAYERDLDAYARTRASDPKRRHAQRILAMLLATMPPRRI